MKNYKAIKHFFVVGRGHVFVIDQPASDEDMPKRGDQVSFEGEKGRYIVREIEMSSVLTYPLKKGSTLGVVATPLS